MNQTPPDMKVRLSAELRRQVEDAARQNNRTLNSEIVSRLEASFATGVQPASGDLAERLKTLEDEHNKLYLEVRRLAHEFSNR